MRLYRSSTVSFDCKLRLSSKTSLTISRYWYEQRDAGKFYKADIFDPVTGFGGFGKGSNKCITDGPFAWFVNHMGPGYRIGPQCIYRSLNDTLSQMAAQKYIDACYKRTKFVDAWVCIELGPHISGHGGVGGKVGARADSACCAVRGVESTDNRLADARSNR